MRYTGCAPLSQAAVRHTILVPADHRPGCSILQVVLFNVHLHSLAPARLRTAYNRGTYYSLPNAAEGSRGGVCQAVLYTDTQKGLLVGVPQFVDVFIVAFGLGRYGDALTPLARHSRCGFYLS